MQSLIQKDLMNANRDDDDDDEEEEEYEDQYEDGDEDEDEDGDFDANELLNLTDYQNKRKHTTSGSALGISQLTKPSNPLPSAVTKMTAGAAIEIDNEYDEEDEEDEED